MLIPKNLDKNGKFQYMLDEHLYQNYFPGNNEGMRKSQAPLDLPILHSLSILWGTDANNPDKSRVGLSMPIKGIDLSQRNLGSGRVLCSLPQATAQELISLIRKNPVHAEYFLTNTFAGLDHIYERTPVNQVLLWDVDNYIPQDVTNFRDPQEKFNKVFRKRFNLNAVTSASYGNAGFFPRQ